MHWQVHYILIPDLMFIFFKIFVIHIYIFFGKFSSKIWTSPKKFGTGVHCYMLITVLLFIFSKFFWFIFFGQIWSKYLKFFKLTEISYRAMLLCAYYNFNVYFFKNFCQSYFFGQIWSDNLKFYKITEILYRGKLLHAYCDLEVYKMLSFI